MSDQHWLGFKNKKEISKSKKCGCFFCLSTFDPKEITEWTDEGQTAVCPKCGVDSILGDDYDISPGALKKLSVERFPNL